MKKIISLALLLLCSLSDGAEPLSEREVEIADRLFELFKSTVRRGSPTQRPVFAKSHGCVTAEFTVNPDLPEEFRVGIFSGTSYPAWIRFSNDGPVTKDARPTARGMAIKLVGVPGDKILEGEEKALTQDFVMQNHPIFFSDNAQDFLDFIEAALSGDQKINEEFNRKHPETERILADMDKNILADPLDGEYWTPTPYKLGQSAMKYKVKPCQTPPPPSTKPMTDDHFLRKNLAAHLKDPQWESSGICMDFWIQVQNNSDNEPIDQATVEWSSPFRRAATLNIPWNQDIDDPDRIKLCENLSFTGWHSLPEHEPLGSINRARKIVYKRMADFRRERNQVPVEEPSRIEP